MSDEREGLPSASELGAIVACPGYQNAKAKFPTSPERYALFAAAGEQMHEALQMSVDGEDQEWENLSAREEWVVSECIKIRRALCEELLGNKDPSKSFTEQRFWLTSAGRRLFSSRLDYAALRADGRHLLVVDYKTGPGHYPEATMNWQIHGGIAAFCSQENASLNGLQRVYGAIIQPLVTRKPVVLELDPGEIAPLQTQISHAIAASNLKSPPRIPGMHCIYCPARGACPEAQSAAPLTIETRWKEGLPHLTPAAITKLLPFIPVIQSRLDALRELAKEILAKDPDGLPGYTLKEVGAGRKITDVNKFAAVVADYVTRDELRPLMTIPNAKVRELWVSRAAKDQSITKKEATDRWELLIEEVSEPNPTQKRLFKKGKSK